MRLTWEPEVKTSGETCDGNIGQAEGTFAPVHPIPLKSVFIGASGPLSDNKGSK